eukprot:1966715-Prymnesium_polylepis.1
MERRFRQHGEDTRVALAQSNFLDHASGEKYWWYAWRDAEMKSWCVPSRKTACGPHRGVYVRVGGHLR